jgi:hypothetical protein
MARKKLKKPKRKTVRKIKMPEAQELIDEELERDFREDEIKKRKLEQMH